MILLGRHGGKFKVRYLSVQSRALRPGRVASLETASNYVVFLGNIGAVGFFPKAGRWRRPLIMQAGSCMGGKDCSRGLKRWGRGWEGGDFLSIGNQMNTECGHPESNKVETGTRQPANLSIINHDEENTTRYGN